MRLVVAYKVVLFMVVLRVFVQKGPIIVRLLLFRLLALCHGLVLSIVKALLNS